jgi:prephenate dehydratase
MGLQRVCAQVRFLGSYPRADGVEAHVLRGTRDDEFVHARAWLTSLRNPQG